MNKEQRLKLKSFQGSMNTIQGILCSKPKNQKRISILMTGKGLKPMQKSIPASNSR